MPRKQSRETVMELIVYVLLSSISREFYVGKIKAGNYYQAYKDHLRLRKSHTRKLITQSKEANALPKMYMCEKLEASHQEAFGHCVAWTKYFFEKGFVPVNNNAMVRYSKDLTEFNQKIYERIQQLPIERVLSEEALLISTYKLKEKKAVTEETELTEARVRKITLHLSEKDHKLIAQKAANEKMSMSDYCQKMALYGSITRLDISLYLAELQQAQERLWDIYRAIETNRRCYPADNENIKKYSQQILEGEKAIKQLMERQAKGFPDYKKLQRENYRLKRKLKEYEKEKE